MFKRIEDAPNYSVNELGDVRNIKTGRVLAPSDNGGGYLYVSLRVNGKYKNFTIHRLVANAFIPNPENKPTVNHKDGDKRNNTVSNLEWATYGENNVHAIKQKLRTNLIQVNVYTLDGTFIGKFDSIADVNDYLGFPHKCTGVHECLFNRNKYNEPIYKGYRFEYLNGGNTGSRGGCKKH